MIGDQYGYDEDTDLDEEDLEEEDDGSNAAEEIDDMLDALVDEAGRDDDFAERRRKQRSASRRRGGKKVSTASGKSTYKQPTKGGQFVTQQQLKTALDKVGGEVRRNAQGIKNINKQVGTVTTRVDGIVAVNTVQSKKLAKLGKQMQLDGALELAESYDGNSINLYQVFKGAIKSGYIGDTKGALGNPAVIGAIGLLLNNPAILGNLTRAAGGGAP